MFCGKCGRKMCGYFLCFVVKATRKMRIDMNLTVELYKSILILLLTRWNDFCKFTIAFINFSLLLNQKANIDFNNEFVFCWRFWTVPLLRKLLKFFFVKWKLYVLWKFFNEIYQTANTESHHRNLFEFIFQDYFSKRSGMFSIHAVSKLKWTY